MLCCRFVSLLHQVCVYVYFCRCSGKGERGEAVGQVVKWAWQSVACAEWVWTDHGDGCPGGHYSAAIDCNL